MTASTEQLERFKIAVSPERREFNLAEAALLVAQDSDASVDVTNWLAQLDVLALPLAARLPPDAAPIHRVLSLNRYLFEELNFRGNDEQYYDPKNSLLHEVIARRVGIPITLSIVYMEIGRRIGLKLSGVSFPGHFLVKMRVSGGELVLDPYSQGRALSEEDLRARLESVSQGAGQGLDPRTVPIEDLIETAPPRQILARLLRNLKAIYVDRQDWANALNVQNRMVILLPDALEERRDRGLIYEKLECPRAAADDLEAYLAKVVKIPNARKTAEDEDSIADLRARSKALREQAAKLN